MAPQTDSGSHHANPDDLAEVLRSPLGLLALQRLPGIGPARALRAALLTAGQDAFLESHAEHWGQALDAAGQELEDCRRADVTALAIFDELYPPRLRALHDPPPVLFVRGSVDVLHRLRSVAVVGTREPTRFGCGAAERVTAALAVAGWTVVSGLAKGIDTIAHRAALQYKTETVAVLAGGLDRIYPVENIELAAAILDRGGALISEQRWGAPLHRSNFVQRNRLQTGLVTAVVVAQTGIVGGTMTTVRYAASQGRPVFCPVPSTDHYKSEGLKVLLDTPSRRLCDLLPAWKDSKSLCDRLGNRTLAVPIHGDRLSEFINAVELSLDSESQLDPEPRWWPSIDSSASQHNQVVENEQEPLFA